MNSYYFVFDIVACINTFLLILYGFLGVFVLKNKCGRRLKIVAFYLLFSCFFDVLSQIVSIYLIPGYLEDSLFLSILYRLGELLIVGYLLNTFWLKSRFVWWMIGAGAVYLTCDFFSYRNNGVLNYVAYSQIFANVVLCVLAVSQLIAQLRGNRAFSTTAQILGMIFLSYFSIHVIYTVIQNFIINQSFSDQSFVLFYCSYVLLHICYYFSLAFVLFKALKNSNRKKVRSLSSI